MRNWYNFNVAILPRGYSHFATQDLIPRSTTMKVSASALTALLLAPLAVAKDATNLRSSPIEDSSCNRAPDKKTCFRTVDATTQEPCSWCEAGAIPSECMSQDQANELPPGVFDCSSPGTFLFNDKKHVLHTKDGANDICDGGVKSIAGYMDISGSDYDKKGQNKHLFFWMFEKRGEVKDDTPFIVWLTGGPGCSSTLALLSENGPCTVNDDGASTSLNPHSWTEAAHVLWLDQPAGVGFSYGSEDDSNEAMVSEDAYYFLQGFFQTYPEYAGHPLYVVGESYGTYRRWSHSMQWRSHLLQAAITLRRLRTAS